MNPVHSLKNRSSLVVSTVLFLGLLGGLDAAPAIDSIANQSVPCGKTLVIPVTSGGTGPFSYTATSTNPKIIPFVKTGNPFLKISVTYPGDGGSSAAFTGDLVFQLFRDLTPTTAKFIAGFAQAGFYDGLKFHRILPLDSDNPISSIIAQAGDPLGTGSGGPGMVNSNPATAFAYDNELRSPLIFLGKGQLAMANSSGTSNYSGTSGSQFFITNGPLRFLDFNHTIFGQLVRGFDVLAKIDAVPTDGSGLPTANVVMSSTTVIEQNTDAVLLLSAAGNVTEGAPATVTVTARDSAGVASTLSFMVSSFADPINDPPIVGPIADLVAPLRKTAQVTIPVEDLEFDPIDAGATFLVNPTGATGSIKANVVTVSPNAATPLGVVRVGVNARQVGAVLRSDPFDRAQVAVGLGARSLTPVNSPLSAAAGQAITNGIVALFRSGVTRAPNDTFTATVNWGDGSPIESGTGLVMVARAALTPNGFAVTGSHTYTRAGQYLVTVTVQDTAATTATMTNTAFVSDGPLLIVTRDLEAASAMLSLREIASFTDSASPGKVADYTSLIDWGDGFTTNGTIRKTARGFSVLGAHHYLKFGAYTTAVKVTKTSSLATTSAWGAVHLSGPIAHLPPFAQVHLYGEVQFVTKISDTSLTAGIRVENSGNKTATGAKLRFYLSADKILDNLDLRLKVGAQAELTILPLLKDLVISGNVTDLKVPAGTSLHGKFLIMEIIASDPIGDFLSYARTAASPTALP